MSDEKIGFSVTPAKLGFVLAIISVLTVGWNVAAHEITQDSRIERVERDREMFLAELKALKDSQIELKEAVIRLTAVMEANAKKAAYVVPADPVFPSRVVSKD